MLNLKKEFYGVLAGVGFVLVLLFTIHHFMLVAWQIVLLLCGIQLLFAIYKYIKSKKFDFKAILKSFLMIPCIVYGIRWLAQYGVWGFILTIAILVGFILYKRWDKYIEVKHHMETMIWGKPLKDFAGKPPKVRITR